jgi:CDP-diacylglycerol--glycerol-3-phosphate 3-phosphatidyltransferase
MWRAAASGNLKGVQLSEWDKPGWTYHAKGAQPDSYRQDPLTHGVYIGIWLSPSSTSLPILTLFGSTNLNSRSAQLDTELSFLMILPSHRVAQPETKTSESATLAPSGPFLDKEHSNHDSEGIFNTSLNLRERLQGEIDNIRANASAWKGDRRDVRFSTKLIVWLVKGML